MSRSVGRSFAGKDRFRRHSVESRSPLSPVMESNRGDSASEPLIARAPLRNVGRGDVATVARTRSGSQPNALSPMMRGSKSRRRSSANDRGRRKTTTMSMLLQMQGDGISLAELASAGTSVQELVLMGFDQECLAAVKASNAPVFPLSDFRRHFHVDRRWLVETLNVDARVLSRTANSVREYVAFGIDAAWLALHGLDAPSMRRFASHLTLSDWVTKMHLEKPMVDTVGLTMDDFEAMGWDRQSLKNGLGFTDTLLDELVDPSQPLHCGGGDSNSQQRQNTRRGSASASRVPSSSAATATGASSREQAMSRKILANVAHDRNLRLGV